MGHYAALSPPLSTCSLSDHIYLSSPTCMPLRRPRIWLPWACSKSATCHPDRPVPLLPSWLAAAALSRLTEKLALVLRQVDISPSGGSHDGPILRRLCFCADLLCASLHFCAGSGDAEQQLRC